MGIIFRTIIVLISWLMYASQANVSVLAMAIFITAGILYQFNGGHE